MSTQLTRIISPSFGLAIVAGLALAACNRGEAPQSAPVATASAANTNAEMAWARAALERNPDIEVVATDPLSGVVTVKHRSTGQVEAIKASELAAVTPSQLKPMERAAAPAPEPEPGPVPTESAKAPSQTAQATAPDSGATQISNQSTSGYTIDRSGGKIRVSGPGVSIESSGSSAAGNQPSAGRRTVDPFICEGRRQLQLDGRDIYVDGDAITVRGGCELFVSNSRIVASGTGVLVRDGVVNLANSYVEGAAASFDAGDHAKLYLRDTVFQGLSRRTKRTTIEDQGGNRGLPAP